MKYSLTEKVFHTNFEIVGYITITYVKVSKSIKQRNEHPTLDDR